MSNQNTRTIHLSTVANLRDLGGLPLQDGVFRPGELYRSTTLAKINTADAGALKAREIKTVFDFHTQAERAVNPDRLDETVTQIHLDVLADSPVAATALFHCTTGKDRTGWATAALLTFLGATRNHHE